METDMKLHYLPYCDFSTFSTTFFSYPCSLHEFPVEQIPAFWWLTLFYWLVIHRLNY